MNKVNHKTSLKYLTICCQVFEQTGVQLMANTQYDALTRIKTLLEFLHEREMDLEDLGEQKHVKLEQCVQLRHFENEAKQVRVQVLRVF